MKIEFEFDEELFIRCGEYCISTTSPGGLKISVCYAPASYSQNGYSRLGLYINNDVYWEDAEIKGIYFNLGSGMETSFISAIDLIAAADKQSRDLIEDYKSMKIREEENEYA